MEKDTSIDRQLKEAGATDDMIAQYQRCLASEDKKGQERLLCRCRRMKTEKLQESRERLACLDYIIAKVEHTQDLEK